MRFMDVRLKFKSWFKGDDEVNKRDSIFNNMKKPSWQMPISHGYYLVEDRTRETESSELEKHLQDSLVVQREEISNLEVWFFSLSDSVIADSISSSMHSHLFSRQQLSESQVRSKSKEAMKKAYISAKAEAESEVSEKTVNVASTSVTVVNGERLVMAQMGGYRVIVCRDGIAHQLQTKHQHKGNSWRHRLLSGAMRIPKVHLQACQLRRQSSRKQNNSTELITVTEKLDADTEFLILASTGVFEVMRNQEAVDLIWHIDDAQEAAECLAREALSRMSKSTISCLVIRFD